MPVRVWQESASHAGWLDEWGSWLCLPGGLHRTGLVACPGTNYCLLTIVDLASPWLMPSWKCLAELSLDPVQISNVPAVNADYVRQHRWIMMLMLVTFICVIYLTDVPVWCFDDYIQLTKSENYVDPKNKFPSVRKLSLMTHALGVVVVHLLTLQIMIISLGKQMI